MKIKNNEKGFVGADIVIGLGILMIFIALVTTIYINSNHNAMSIQRTAKSTEIITNIFEKMDLAYYDEIPECESITLKNDSEKNLIVEGTNNETCEKLRNILAGINIPNGYKVSLDVKIFDPNSRNGNNLDTIDLVKNISVSVKYKVSKKEEEVTIDRIISREKLIIPNEPILEKETYAIKYNPANEMWYNAEDIDNQWYNYKNITITNYEGNDILNGAAYSVKMEDVTLSVRGEILFNEGVKPKVWIPAYGRCKVNLNEYKYLYSKTGKTTQVPTNSTSKIPVISDEEFLINEFFGNETDGYKEGIWVEIGDTKYTDYIEILSNSQMK